MEINEQPKWYILHTYSGHEQKVERDLRAMVENNNLKDLILDIKVPMEDEVVEKDGKRKVVQRKKFPTYICIKMIYTNHVWFMVTSTDGVTGFVGPKGRPLPLRDDEVKRMGLEVVTLEDFDIKVGDQVRVINGALEGFIGDVDSISAERQKVRVVVAMFGRQTPVELDFAQVEKI